MKNYIVLLCVTILVAGLPFIAGSQVAFPVKTSTNGRYLVDQNNKPFPILGRTAWAVISQPVSRYQAFIENTLSHGFNSIEMAVIFHWPDAQFAPHNGRGDIPFMKRLDGSAWNGSLLVYDQPYSQSADLTAPNEEYWRYVDSFLDHCKSKGILVFLFPAYVGAIGSNDGWMKELVANGGERARAYGAWVANRYKNQDNIVWMLLGDRAKYTLEEKKVEAALIEGLKSVPGQRSTHYSAESNEENSADQVDFGDQMTLNGLFTWGGLSVPRLGRHAYSHKPVLPAYLLEEPYDEEGPDGNNYNPHAIQPVRRFHWWGWLTTIGGYVAGNGYIWPFIDPRWKGHLNTAGTLDMQRLNGFIKSIDWWELVPSGLNGMKNLITIGGSMDSSNHYVAAAATPEGTLLIAYIPPDHTGSITVDMTALKDKIKAYWYDPASGTSVTIAGSPFNNKNSHMFTPPGKNGSGQNDWVLMLAASGF